MFNFKKQDLVASFDQTIIDGFYGFLNDWIRINPGNEGEDSIESVEQLKELWNLYRPQLSKMQQKRADELQYVVFSEPQILPAEFTYLDVFKAALLISIPDLLLINKTNIGLRRFSTDQLFTLIRQESSGDGYQLTADYSGQDTSACTKAFMSFVVENEMSSIHSALKKIAEYLQFLQEPNRYTRAHCMLMSLDAITGYLQNILNDEKITTALFASSIKPVQLVEMLNEMFGFCLSACFADDYTNKDGAQISQKSLSRADLDSKKMRDLSLELKIFTVVTSVQNMWRNFHCDQQDSKGIIQQYRSHAKTIIRQEFSPKTFARFQKLYDKICFSKNLKSLFDLYKKQKNSRMILGVVFAIENYFSYQQMTKLIESLRRFVSLEIPEASMVQRAFRFFQSTPPNLQTVINMADDDESRMDILFVLRRVIRMEAQKNPYSLAEPYKTLKSFILDEPEAGVTVESFMEKITKIVPENVKSRIIGVGVN